MTKKLNYDARWYEEVTDKEGNVEIVPRQITEPGIYLDMPIDVYHAQLAVSNTGIKQLIKSPWEYWFFSALNTNKESFKVTPSLNKGQKFHKYLLERDTFFDDYVIKSDLKKDGTPKANQTYAATGTDKETGKQYVGGGELKDIKKAINILGELMPKTCEVLLKGARREVSMFWVDERTGVLCRCRHDIFKPIVTTDYKTTQSCSQREAIRAMASYDYFIQAAFYMDGNRTVFANHLSDDMRKELSIDDITLEKIKNHSNYCFLFQESAAPFTPFALTVEDNMLERGRELYEHGLDVYVESMRKWGMNEPWKHGEDKIVGVGIDELEAFGCGYYLHKIV